MRLQKIHLLQSSPEIKIDTYSLMSNVSHLFKLLGMHGFFILKEICFEVLDSI